MTAAASASSAAAAQMRLLTMWGYLGGEGRPDRFSAEYSL